MGEKSKNSFYVVLLREKDKVQGHAIVYDNADLSQISIPKSNERTAELTLQPAAEYFFDTIREFVSVMETYRRFIPLAMALAPQLSAKIAEINISDFAKERGKSRPDLSCEEKEVYELGYDCHRELIRRNESTLAAMAGAKHLPEVMIIGLISVYDAFLSRLLRLVISMREEIVFTSDKMLKFSELSQYGSIADARDAIISREVEAVIRQSHHEQFSWMEKKLSLKLREDLSIWADFIEICERRNLLTHTGGYVSSQYIANCKSHGLDVSGIQVGTKLDVDKDYYSRAVNVVYEIGVKLGHVLWRKFSKDERELADGSLNELALDLITSRSYSLAESILLFGVNVIKTHSSERIRRMMLINLSNSVRLQDRQDDAKKILLQEDWSATSDDFQICVAAVNENISEVIALMRRIGKDGSIKAEEYRTWPVFRGIRSDESFKSTFQSIFGEPLQRPAAVNIASIEAERHSNNQGTRH